MSIMLYDQCPYCLAPYLKERRPPEIPTNGCIIGVCQSCGHLVAIGLDSEDRMECGTFDYDWLHKWYKDHLEIMYNLQEQEHHKLGHWG